MPRPDRLADYRGKRDPDRTPEPAGAAPADAGSDPPAAPRFVVQEHHASRLHWDLRLEHDGVLVSWAIPNGIPLTPQDNRLAVPTEDHPLGYIDFSGEIPAGEYGAGTMTIWDTGTYVTEKWSTDKVEVSLHGERLTGRYGLLPLVRRSPGEAGGAPDWMIHRMDPPQDPDREPLPDGLVPMLSEAGAMPRDPEGWAFEVKWDGVRALAYVQPGRLRLQSRSGRDITAAYPEVRGLCEQLGMRDALLDGEIVAFDDADPPRPSFERLQRRMHVTSPSAIRRLRSSTPVVFAIFDLLHLDGRSLLARTYDERRAALQELGLGGPAWRVPAAHLGADGRRLHAATAAQGLEGIVAKRRDARYEPGRRTGSWVKVKHVRRQELVIGGWLPGEGRRRERIGALLMGVHDPDPGTGTDPNPGTDPGPDPDGAPTALRYAGRVGTGFTERTLADLARRLAPLETEATPFSPAPKLPSDAVHVRPELVAEIAFAEWTSDGVMRAPSFKGLRDDQPAAAVVREPVGAEPPAPDAPAPATPDAPAPADPESLFDTVARRPDGALAVTLEGRSLKLTNWDKVLFPQTGFTKGDLIAYYARIAPQLLPHLRDRPLTLKRYPNGVDAPFFYEKQAPGHRPKWVQTVRVRGVDYVLCQERATLVWLANLADLELHTSLSLAAGPDSPTALVFDLDPGPPAGLPECAEVALVLRGLFAQLGLESLVKVSGSKGMQVYVPLNSQMTYAQTKPFARQVAEALEQRLPERVVSRMAKTLRPGRVLVDWSQNDAHKTTVSVYSVRARPSPTVSAPVSWEEVRDCRDSGDPGGLVLDTEAVLARAARAGDAFAPLVSLTQRLAAG